MATDPLNETLNLLSNNWTSSNTDNKTPRFIKITDVKKHDFRLNQDLICTHRNNTTNEYAGLGVDSKHITEKFNIDVRVFGENQESHFLNVIEEIKRIFTANKRNPSTNYNILEFNGDGTDLSDKTYKVFRKLIPVQLYKYNKQWS